MHGAWGCDRPEVVEYLVGKMRKSNYSQISEIVQGFNVRDKCYKWAKIDPDMIKVFLKIKEGKSRIFSCGEESLLHMAVSKRSGSLEMVKVILSDLYLSSKERQLYLRTRSEKGEHPIQKAMREHSDESVEVCIHPTLFYKLFCPLLKCIQFLWKAQTIHSFQEYQAMSYWAKQKGNIQRFRELLDCAKRELGKEAAVLLQMSIRLLDSCREGKVEIVKELLSVKEIDITELRGEKLNTILHESAENGHVEVAKRILENISKDKKMEFLSLKNSENCTGVDMGRKEDREEVVEVRLFYLPFCSHSFDATLPQLSCIPYSTWKVLSKN